MYRPTVFQSVRETVDEQTPTWRSSPFVGYHSSRPMSTFRDVISTAFLPAQRTWRSASNLTSATRYEHESRLGSLRHSRSYSSLAPSLAMPFRERSAERYVPSSRAYEPKRHDWRHELSDYNSHKSFNREVRAYRPPMALNERSRYEPSKPSYEYRHAIDSVRYLTDCRRAFYTPVTPPRHENHKSYWQGRLQGVWTAAPFLIKNYDLDNERRYNRYYCNLKTKSMEVFGYLRKFNGTYYESPKHVLLAY